MFKFLMLLSWKIDDIFPFWTPFSWLGNRFEDRMTYNDLANDLKEQIERGCREIDK